MGFGVELPNFWVGHTGGGLVIYFAHAAELGLVKIGYTAGETADARLASIQTACPSAITLLATMPGDPDTERALHAAFAGLRVRGEWFRYGSALQDLVAGIQRTGGRPDGFGDRCWRLRDPESPEGLLARVVETAYRRAFQHAVGAVADLLRGATPAEAERLLAGANRAAFDLRFSDDRHPDYTREFLARSRTPKE